MIGRVCGYSPGPFGLATVAAASLMAGCASFTDVPLSPERNAQSFQARSLRDDGLLRFLDHALTERLLPGPSNSWNFQTLTLAALYYHPDLDTARSQVAIATAGNVTAAQRPNPTVSFAPTRVTNPASGMAPWIWGWSFSIPIETAGKRGYRMAQASQLSESARLNLGAAGWQVRSRLRSSLLNFYGANQTRNIRARQQDNQKDLVRMMEQRLSVGEASPFELTVSRLALDQTVLALREAERQEAEGRASVASAIGIPAMALEGVEIGFDGLQEPPPVEVVSDSAMRRLGLLGRSDMLAALADYRASQSALQLEIARQYPDINLGPGYQWDQGDNKITFGASMVLPLFHQNQGAIATAEAQRKSAAARFNALQTRVSADLDRALGGFHLAKAKLAAADDLVSLQDKQLHSIEAQLQAGESDRVALLMARVEQGVSALARLDALLKAQQALGALEDAVQRPLDGTVLRSELVAAQPRRNGGMP